MPTQTLKKFTLLIFILLLTACSHPQIIYSLDQTPQNTRYYLSSQKQYTIKPAAQQKLTANFLAHYFSPWTDYKVVNTPHEILNMQLKNIHRFLLDPEWAANQRPHTVAWVEQLAANMNLNKFPNLNARGITIFDANARMLPTNEPSFEDWYSATKGYPFDQMQESFVPANTPVKIMHISKDGAWYLVATSSFVGWIPSHAVATTTPSFINSWQTGKYVVATRDNIALFDDQSHPRFKARIGVIYPLLRTTEHYYVIAAAATDKNHHAVILSANLPKQNASPFPMIISNQNFALMTDKLLGNPYGWGGMYGWRDCSSTIMDLMANFGIWLPRNSADQARTGQFINMQSLKPDQKERILIHQGIPFLTLVRLPGHITLYIGTKDGMPYVFHDMWGLHLRDLNGQMTEAVVGRTIISPLRYGRKLASGSSSLAMTARGITILIPPNMLEYQ